MVEMLKQQQQQLAERSLFLYIIYLKTYDFKIEDSSETICHTEEIEAEKFYQFHLW